MSGLVTQVDESHFDGQVTAAGFDNVIVIQHDDGTTTLYGHLTHDGAVVGVGGRILQSALVGYSGNTGNTNNRPHLHLSAASLPLEVAGLLGRAANPPIELDAAGFQVGHRARPSALICPDDLLERDVRLAVAIKSAATASVNAFVSLGGTTSRWTRSNDPPALEHGRDVSALDVIELVEIRATF